MTTTVVPLVLDLSLHVSIVDLQDQIEGNIKKITLTDWMIDSEIGPYFQIKFSQGIQVKSLSYSQNRQIIENAIQIPRKGKKKEIPISRCGPLFRRFTLELFDSIGNPLGDPFKTIRCVLWFLFEW